MTDFLLAALLWGATLLLGAVSFTLVPRSGGPTPDRVAREGGTVFLGQGAMRRGYLLAGPVIRWLAARGVSPDALTWLSFFLGAGAGCAIGFGWPGLAAWLLGISGLCDLLDGAVARAARRTTPGGAALDSSLDRYVEFFFLAGLIAWFDGHLLFQLLSAAALLGSFMVTYSTAKAEALRVRPPRGWMKRSERLVWLIYGAALAGVAGRFGYPPTAIMAAVVAIIALFANLSAVLRLHALHRAANEGSV